jgi:FAD/FMN-containing dehydrogenase
VIPHEERIQEFSNELSRSFAGEMRFDRYSRLMYSTDASIYQIEPLGVLIPRSHDDVAAAVSVAGKYEMPLLSRGGGTSASGQTIGAAVVIDYSKYMNKVLETNHEEHWTRVQPGVVLDQLNAHLLGSGYHFGPDVSTSNRATIGGMIGNNSCGSRSIIYGKTSDHVREVRALLSGGSGFRFSDVTPGEWLRKTALATEEGKLYGAVDRIVRENQDEIIARYPKIMRHVGGYALDSIALGSVNNLSTLILGSEGTLATCTEAVLNLEPVPGRKGLIVIHFTEISAAMDALAEILSFKPSAVELIDKMILDLTRAQPQYTRKMAFAEGNPAAILLVEFYGETASEIAEKLNCLEQRLRTRGMATTFFQATGAEAQADIWAIRKAGLGMLSSIRGDWKPLAFIEDTAVAPEKLSAYANRLRQILARHNAKAGIYGHASVGCLHVRPLINLKKASEIKKMVDIATAVKDLVVEFKGAMSAEHGDGLSRSHWNRELFGEQLYAAFCDLKKAFDPTGIMNPGKIVNAPPMTANLRYSPSYTTHAPETYIDFSLEGGVTGALEQCCGLGACRKVEPGTMCPSYRATMEEEHSTRGRANMLRAAISGLLPIEEFTSRRMFEVLDLCLECKACKTECPANVDIAKLKYEFLAHYNARHGTPLRSMVFGNIAT